MSSWSLLFVFILFGTTILDTLKFWFVCRLFGLSIVIVMIDDLLVS